MARTLRPNSTVRMKSIAPFDELKYLQRAAKLYLRNGGKEQPSIFSYSSYIGDLTWVNLYNAADVRFASYRVGINGRLNFVEDFDSAFAAARKRRDAKYAKRAAKRALEAKQKAQPAAPQVVKPIKGFIPRLVVG